MPSFAVSFDHGLMKVLQVLLCKWKLYGFTLYVALTDSENVLFNIMYVQESVQLKCSGFIVIAPIINTPCSKYSQ